MNAEDWVTGNITLSIGGTPFDMQLTVPANPVKPHRMLPIFQKMTDSFVDLSVQAAEENGEKVSCKAGCGACCRQPVPLSEAEVYQIKDVLDAMPDDRREIIKQRFAEAVSHFREIGWFDKMSRCVAMARTHSKDAVAEELQEIVAEYFREGISCPFLMDESCSIHEDRPLSCREYLVTSPAENCSAPSAKTIRKVPLLMEPSKAMKSVGTTGSFYKMGLIPLILAPALASEVPEHFVEKKGEQWVADFFGFLTGSEDPRKGLPKNQGKTKKRQKKGR